jgi:hypothetical protein
MTGGEVPIDTYARVSFLRTKYSRNSGANDQINSSTWFRTQIIVFSMYSNPAWFWLQGSFFKLTSADQPIQIQESGNRLLHGLGGLQSRWWDSSFMLPLPSGSWNKSKLGPALNIIGIWKEFLLNSRWMWIQVSPAGFSWIVTRMGTSHVGTVKALFYGFKCTWTLSLNWIPKI